MTDKKNHVMSENYGVNVTWRMCGLKKVISKTGLILGQGSGGENSLFTSVVKTVMKPTVFSIHCSQFVCINSANI